MPTQVFEPDEQLTAIAIGYKNDKENYIADKILPYIPVESAQFTDVVRLLNRNDLGFLSEPLKLGEARPIFDNKVNHFNAACWELEFKGAFFDRFGSWPGMPEPDLLKTIAADWIVRGAKSQTIVKFEQEEKNNE